MDYDDFHYKYELLVDCPSCGQSHVARELKWESYDCVEDHRGWHGPYDVVTYICPLSFERCVRVAVRQVEVG